MAASPDRVAVVPFGEGFGEGVRATWAELAAAALRAVADLEAAGIVRGDRVVHVGPHSLEWIVVDLACVLAGFVHVPIEHAPDSFFVT